MRNLSYLLLLGVWLLLACAPNMASAAESASSIEGFIDGVMERSIATGETVGATVALVQNGRLVVSRGYGFADRERGIAVESRVSQFRIGSISKIFVWMGVLQLVEAGKLDLDADINSYLTELQIPSDFTDPVTLRHLMTHTAGFDDNLVDLFVSGPRQVGELSQTLAKQIPRRVRLPGNLVSYSNYGAALAGHVVAQVSGQSWDDYVDAHLFRPMGMTRATTRQPVSDEIESTRANGYTKSTSGAEEQGFVYLPLAPAGAGTATSLDMARLMVELLNPRGTSVLSTSSKAQLLGGAYISDPLVNGMTLGMYEMTDGATRAVGHGGNTLLFNSQMILWPDERMGLFISTNTFGSEKVATDLIKTISRHLGLAARAKLVEPEPQVLSDISDYFGDYIGARRSHSGYTKLMGLFDSVRVTQFPEETELWVEDLSGGKRYYKIAPDVFQQWDSNDRIVFKRTERGATEMYFSTRPMVGYSRAELVQTPLANILLIVVWLFLAAGVVFVWPLSSIARRRARRTLGQRFIALLTFAAIAVVILFVVQMAMVAPDAYQLLVGGFSKIPPLLWLPAIFGGLVILRVLYLYRVWADGYWWASRRLHFTALLIVECILLAWFWYWHLLPEVLYL